MTVDLRGLNSGEPKRDEKLADQWVVTNKDPFAYFVSTEICHAPQTYTAGAEASFTLVDDLTLRGLLSLLCVPLSTVQRLRTVRKAPFLMSDFGIEPPNTFNFVVVEDEVKITVDFVAWAD